MVHKFKGGDEPDVGCVGESRDCNCVVELSGLVWGESPAEPCPANSQILSLRSGTQIHYPGQGS